MRSAAWVVTVAALAVATVATAAPPAERPAHVDAPQIKKVRLRVEGIACDSCSARLRDAMRKLDGVVAVEVKRAEGELAVDFDAAKTSEEAIRGEVAKHGFTVK